MPSQRISSLDILFHLTMAVKIDTLNHTTVSVRNSVEATELGIWTSQVLISRVTVAEWCTWTPPVVYKRTPWTISTPGSYTEGPDGEMRRKRAARRGEWDRERKRDQRRNSKGQQEWRGEKERTRARPSKALEGGHTTRPQNKLPGTWVVSGQKRGQRDLVCCS